MYNYILKIINQGISLSQNSKNFRLFISSTFNDFRKEREVLQKEVFPHIKEYAAKQGYVFQPIDLRWGVSNDAQLDQKTLELCLNEVKACKTHLHPNFLIMIGDRYGWVPLPYAIEEKEFENIQQNIEESNDTLKIEYKRYKVYDDSSNNMKKFHYEQKDLRIISQLELLKQWYTLDENQIPTSYILNEREKKSDYEIYENWEAEESILRRTLQDAVNLSNLTEEQKRKYFLSATEAEVEEGIIPYLNHTKFQKDVLLEKDSDLHSVDPQHIFGFFRDIDKATQIGNKFIQHDYDEAQAFKERVKPALLEKNILPVETTQINKETLEESYLEEFEEKIRTFLKSQIDAQKTQEEKDEFTALQTELEAQKYFAVNKRKNFLGQKVLRKEIKKYISNEEHTPFIIYGKSGSGKSALMSQAIHEAEEAKEKRVLYRFVSATPNASSSKEILTSIFEELEVDVRSEGEKEKKENDEALSLDSNDKQETFEDFSYRIHTAIQNIEEDVVIFIDAVDQLQNDDQFLWLPQTLPDNVKIVISALEDEKYKDDSKFFDALKTKTTNLHEIPEFHEAEALLEQLLKNEDRTVDKFQKEHFLKQFKEVKSPLYVTIAAQVMKNWKSGDKSQTLSDTQQGIIKKFIKNLTDNYHQDERFVQKVLGYIYASRDGLSESELLQLLETDEEFVKLMADEEFHKNHTLELPLVHWSRLQTQLKPFLSLKTQDGEELMYFFHREFEDVVKQKTSQRDEHDEIIEATQKLILQNQDKDFDENRWGKLYITLITEYNLKYKNKKEVFVLFLADVQNMDRKWIEELLLYISKISLEKIHLKSLNEGLCQIEISNDITKLLKETIYDDLMIQAHYLDTLQWMAYIYSALRNHDMSYEKSKELLSYYEFLIAREKVKPMKEIYINGYITSLNNFSVAIKKQIETNKNSIILEDFKKYEKKADELVEEIDEKSDNGMKSHVLTLINTAISLDNEYKSLAAIEKIHQALEILKNSPSAQSYIDSNDWRTESKLSAYANLIIFYKKINNIEESINYGQMAYDLVKNLYHNKPKHWIKYYIDVLVNFAGVLEHKHEQQIYYLKEAEDILKEWYTIDEIQWAEEYTKVLGNIAFILSLPVNVNNKMQYLDKIIEISQKHNLTDSDQCKYAAREKLRQEYAQNLNVGFKLIGINCESSEFDIDELLQIVVATYNENFSMIKLTQYDDVYKEIISDKIFKYQFIKWLINVANLSYLCIQETRLESAKEFSELFIDCCGAVLSDDNIKAIESQTIGIYNRVSGYDSSNLIGMTPIT